MFTCAPHALYYAGEGRMYSLLWFLGLVLAWSTVELTRRGPRPYLFLLWSLSGAAGLLTHYFFAFVWLACFTWLWFHPGKEKRTHLVAGALVTGLLVLPWYLQLPDSLGRWRITGDWLTNPLLWKQALAAPFILTWSHLSGCGVWGCSVWTDALAAGLYALLGLIILRQGLRRLLSRRRQLLWLWLLAAALGPVLLDVLMHTNASTVTRYALPGLPAAMLLAALGMSQLSRRAHTAFLLLVLLAWLPALLNIFTAPSRPWVLYPRLAARLEAWAQPSDLIIVHSIPSGVLGVARYLRTHTPLASWIVQLGQRRIPDDMDTLLEGRCRVALVKTHYLYKPSPAEAWLREYATLDRQDRLHPFTEILYFFLKSPNRSFTTRCQGPLGDPQ
jgi:uncharacterized membrane protein